MHPDASADIFCMAGWKRMIRPCNRHVSHFSYYCHVIRGAGLFFLMTFNVRRTGWCPSVSRTGGRPDDIIFGRGVFLTVLLCPPDGGCSYGIRLLLAVFPYHSLTYPDWWTRCPPCTGPHHRPARFGVKKLLQFSNKTAEGNMGFKHIMWRLRTKGKNSGTYKDWKWEMKKASLLFMRTNCFKMRFVCYYFSFKIKAQMFLVCN